MNETKEMKGRSKGGHARARALTAVQRSDAARQAALVRWNVPRATHVGMLKIGDLEISCAVLEDGRRVLSQSSLGKALGMTIGGYQHRKRALSKDMGELPLFLVADNLKPFITEEFINKVSEPILFKSTRGGVLAIGLEASLLPEVCEIWLKAKDENVLLKSQASIAERANILMRGLARVGIIALIDEATGYQHDRPQDALARILEAFIAKELQPWVRTFPRDYYQELFRLRGLDYPSDSVQRPQYFGVLTNDIVYKRLAPGVLEELKKATPKSSSGRPKHKFFQMLTNNIGYPKLREHLGAVVAIMKLSNHYAEFLDNLDKVAPRYGDTIPLALAYEKDKDDGKGI